MHKPTPRKRIRKDASKAVISRVDITAELLEMRRRFDWNQIDAGAYLGADQTQISRWERGNRCGVPAVVRLVGLAARLSAPLVLASLGVAVRGEPWDVLARVLGGQEAARLWCGVDEWTVRAWRIEAPRSVARLAAVVELAQAFEPAAVKPIVVTPQYGRLLRYATEQHALAEGRGDDVNAAKWSYQVERLREKVGAEG